MNTTRVKNELIGTKARETCLLIRYGIDAGDFSNAADSGF